MKSGLAMLVMAGMLGGCGAPEGDSVLPGEGAYPLRIVCATPGLTEVVFALGAGDRVVGVSDYAVWPAEALAVPRIGGWVNPDRERLLALQPDLILTQGLHEPLARFAAQHGIRLAQIPTDSLADVLAQFRLVGRWIGVTEQADEITVGLEQALAGIQARVAGRPVQRVALLLERPDGVMRNLTTVGPRTFLSELLALAGGENVFGDVVGDYPQVSREALLLRAPEVIIELHGAPLRDERKARILSDWQGLGSVPAVQQGRIVFLAGDHTMIPGPRVVDTARALAMALHPEAF